MVKGRHNSGALCPFASMVTGDAATAVVTHAWRVGSRLEECLEFSPRARCLRDLFSPGTLEGFWLRMQAYVPHSARGKGDEHHAPPVQRLSL